MKRYWIGLAALAALTVLTGCGGGAGASSSGSGGSGGSGTGGTTTPAMKGTALVTVNATTNTATIKPLDPSSRAVFSGAALSLNSVKVNEDPGEVTVRQLAVTVTNNTQGPLSNLRFAISGVTPLTAPLADDRANVTVGTYAGNGSTGSTGGSLLASNVSAPYGLWTDTDGSVYYTATTTPGIHKISGGMVSTVLSTPSNLPYGLVGDANYLYYCDYTHDVVNRVSKDGRNYTTIAGVYGVTGSTDGAPGTSKLDQPTGLTFDSQGNLWVCDFLNNHLRKITNPGGASPVTSTLAWTGQVPSSPYAISDVNLDGVEYLAVGQYSSAAKIFLIDPNTGTSNPITGTTSTAGANGPASGVGFNIVRGVLSSGGSLLISELGHQDLKILYRPSSGVATDPTSWDVASLAGSTSTGSTDGSGTTASFNSPTGLAFAQDGSLLVADFANNKIRRAVISNFAQFNGVGNSPSTGSVVVGSPDTSVATDSGVPNPAFLYTSILPAGGSTTLHPWNFSMSTGVTSFQFVVTVDGLTSYAGPLDAVNHSTASGSALDYLGTLTQHSQLGVQILNGPLASISTVNNLYPCFASDGTAFLATNTGVMRVDTSGNVSLIAGGTAGASDGVGRGASFLAIDSVACSADGTTVYVTDNQTVRRIHGSGSLPGNWTVSTIAGAATTTGSARGNGSVTRFSQPSGVATSPDGSTVYVADSGNNEIVVMTPMLGNDLTAATSWSCTTLAGNGTAGFADGTPGELNNPENIAMTPTGTLVINDVANYRVRALTSGGVLSTIAGNGTVGDIDGPQGVNEVNPAWGIAVGSSGYIYFIDHSAAIRRISPTGDVETVASGTDSGDGNCAVTGTGGAFSLGVSPNEVLWFDAAESLRSLQRIVGN